MLTEKEIGIGHFVISQLEYMLNQLNERNMSDEELDQIVLVGRKLTAKLLEMDGLTDKERGLLLQVEESYNEFERK